MTNYNKQAKEFMKKVGVSIDMQQIRPNLAFRPSWADKDEVQHGLEYRVSLYKADGTDYRFSFWDSVHNATLNKRPTAYDILAALNPSFSESFEEFCSEFGYDTDSITAKRTWEAIKKETAGLKALFSEEELDMLGEIQ